MARSAGEATIAPGLFACALGLVAARREAARLRARNAALGRAVEGLLRENARLKARRGACPSEVEELKPATWRHLVE